MGGEYTDTTFQNFCSTNGIFHQFSCPHTHQQNGVAKRKHRHIVDTALALISQSNLPLTYWPYSFATSVFLINKLRTETSILNHLGKFFLALLSPILPSKPLDALVIPFSDLTTNTNLTLGPKNVLSWGMHLT